MKHNNLLKAFNQVKMNTKAFNQVNMNIKAFNHLIIFSTNFLSNQTGN